MFSTALSLFLLRKLSFEHFEFPRWQAILGITAIGVLAGIDPSFRLDAPDVPSLPVWLSVLLMLALVWADILFIAGVLRWWLKFGYRWDGRGNFFNLVAASWLISGILRTGLRAVGVDQVKGVAPHAVTLLQAVAFDHAEGVAPLLLTLYSYWVVANALSGAIPKVSRGYAIGGFIISAILEGLLIALLLFGVGRWLESLRFIQ